MSKLNGSATVLSLRSQLAIARFGEQVCLHAIKLNKEGNGANTISYEVFECTNKYYGKTRMADQAIDAGREMLAKPRARLLNWIENEIKNGSTVTQVKIEII